ncbi:MAG: hypothetical protein LBB04_00300 [Oscillospiraceae bacterium]|jgi:flagellar basal body rod protein FlgG|nr:hypothetical protein [Oscillospiraceae bacterium]
MGLEGLGAAARALQKGIDVAAYNGANQNSGGHKADQFILRTGAYSSSGVAQRATTVRGSEKTTQIPRGIGKARMHQSQEQGALRETGVAENCAIEGLGHFVVGQVDQMLGADPMKLHPLHPDACVDVGPGATILRAFGDVQAQTAANVAIAGGDLYDSLGNPGVGGVGPGNPAVAPLVVLPIKPQADRGNAFGVNRIGAPNQASANGTLRTVLSRFGDFEWSSEVPFTTPGAVFGPGAADRTSTFSWLQTMDGDIVCGWPNLNLYHPTNKTPQYKDGHMDVAGQTGHQAADRADVPAGGGVPPAAPAIGAAGFDRIGFKAVPCSAANMCFFRIPEVRKYEPIEITAEGAVVGMVGTEKVELGRIAIAKVSAPQNLKKIGNSRVLYSEPAGDLLVGAQAVADGIGEVASGVVELSNVDLAEQSVFLVTYSANYGWVLHALSKGASNLERVTEIIR